MPTVAVCASVVFSAERLTTGPIVIATLSALSSSLESGVLVNAIAVLVSTVPGGMVGLMTCAVTVITAG